MDPDTVQLEALVAPVCDIVKQAGQEIMKIYLGGFEVEEKEDRSPRTTADLASHRLICRRLQSLTPDIPVLSEESASVPYSQRMKWKRYWLIDPLDGTREFIKKNGEFTVNVALVIGHAARLGAVYLPVQETCYYAAAGHGAFKQEKEQAACRIRTRVSTPDARPTVCGSRSHAGRALQALLARIGSHELISVGSSIKTCLVAEGKADLYPRFGPTSEWDTAAAHCIVHEAGGSLVDTQLRDVRYNTKDSLLNPSFIVFGSLNDPWRDMLLPRGAR